MYVIGTETQLLGTGFGCPETAGSKAEVGP